MGQGYEEVAPPGQHRGQGMKKPPTTEDLEALTCLQNELEETLLDRLGVFIKEHPEADSSQFAVNVFLSLAGRVGISHLGTGRTAHCMETVAGLVRKHGASEPGIH